MRLRKEITELFNAGVINSETANRINEYYNSKSGTPQNRLVIVFGIFGALLVGLGIILILAHNWDEIGRPLRAAIAFGVLLLAQALTLYAVIRRAESVVWTEAASGLLVAAVGAAITANARS